MFDYRGFGVVVLVMVLFVGLIVGVCDFSLLGFGLVVCWLIVFGDFILSLVVASFCGCFLVCVCLLLCLIVWFVCLRFGLGFTLVLRFCRFVCIPVMSYLLDACCLRLFCLL